MKFPVTEEMVQSSLCRGISLEEEMKVSLWQYILVPKIELSLACKKKHMFMPAKYFSCKASPQLPITGVMALRMQELWR